MFLIHRIAVRCVSFVADVLNGPVRRIGHASRTLAAWARFSPRQRSWDLPFAVFFRPAGECAFRRLAPAVALALGVHGTRIWPRDPMLRIEAVALATFSGFGPADKLC